MALAQIQLNDALFDYMMRVSDREPPLLARLREETRNLDRAFWQIPANQGQFMALLVALLKPKRLLEIGTFTGYSSLAMALAMPADARLLCCDISAEYTDIARRYWREAGVADRIELALGPAVETLDGLIAGGAAGAFDLVFIDANKNDYARYFEQSLVLARPGALIIVDNTLFSGRVAGQNLAGLADWQLAWTEDVKRFNEKIHRDPRVTLAMIAVGDGMTLCVKN
jgi:predicted O-methyltransferase YrrM